MPHYFYLDESGDPGLSGFAKSSDYFTLAIVQLATRAPLPELVAARQALRLPANFEFKYHNTERRPKTVFFKVIQPIPFHVRAVVIDKSRLSEYFGAMSGSELMVEFITRLALRASVEDMAKDELIIDGATSPLLRALRIRLSAECRALGRVRPFKRIVSGDSKREDGLQLADMIASAIRHYTLGIAPVHYESFASKILDLWKVPPRK